MLNAAAMNDFGGFDHIDTRVRSLAAVESFYDALMPALGLGEKRYAFVDAAGDWHDGTAQGHNAVEYYEAARDAAVRHFIGFIEDPQHVAGKTRIAFRVPRDRFDALEKLVAAHGAHDVERSEDMAQYPAIFFADPAGTPLEFVARRPA